jgi:Kef-type K+ transport system membrane component KefB
VGLASKLDRLLREIRPATAIWAVQVTLCFVMGFGTARWILGLPTIAAVVIGIALTATSVGVAVSLWSDAGLLETEDGSLLLDLAELDDISAVVALSVLVAVLEPMANGAAGELVPTALWAIVVTLIKVLVFIVGCILFSRFVEPHLTRLTARSQSPGPTLLLVLAGSGFLFSAAAALLGLSIAIGAFFAGLAFSRDPAAVRADASFGPLFEFFLPFFFIWVGMRIELDSLAPGFRIGAVLLIPAVLGKYWGTAWPARILNITPRWRALSVSMIPRAEIALLVVGAAHALGPWVVPDELLAGMVLVCAATTIGAPLLLRHSLPPPNKGNPGTVLP